MYLPCKLVEKIKTIEYVETDAKYSKLQTSLINITVYSAVCTPGMIMGSIELLEKFNQPDEITIREQLDGNIADDWLPKYRKVNKKI